jgi:Immunity protein Imm1
MKYTVSWDGPNEVEPDRERRILISTVAELDAALDEAADQAVAEQLPYAVQVDHPRAPGCVTIGLGDEERAFVDWLTPEGRREYAFEPHIPVEAGGVAFDVNGEWYEHDPEELRVTPMTAREAARQYVRTGLRPTCVDWARPLR